jgi:tRNA nucleotidyltransferase/poly(A) polymerase
MFSSADIPVTPVESSSSASTTSASVDKEKKTVMSGISAAEVFRRLTAYNPDTLPAVLKKIAADIAATQQQTDATTIIAALENLATQCQLDPQSLSLLANWYTIVDNKERAIGLYRDCIHFHKQNLSLQNEDNKNNFTEWLYQLSTLLTFTQQYEEARLMLARSLCPDDTYDKLNASLNNEIMKVAHTLNENLLLELQEQANKKSDASLAETIHQSIRIQQKPMTSDGYVHRATTFLMPYKANRDRRKLEAAFADYCMAHWLVSAGLDGNCIENGESYQATLKKNCSTLAGKLGYTQAPTTPENNPALVPPNMSDANNKTIFVMMKAQSLYALNPNIDYETLHLKARQLYDLHLMPAVLCVPVLNKMKIHYKLDAVTLSFIAKKERELFLSNMLIHQQAEKNASNVAPAPEKTAETKQLLKEFKNAEINEKALPILISILGLDLDRSLRILDIQEQNEIFKKALELLKKLHHLSDPKDSFTKNAKTMATKFAHKNPKKAIEYINLAIAEDEVDPKSYMFRADMQLQEANDTYHYQLALADYYFAKWTAARGCGSTVLDALEINKISRQINSTKEKMAALVAVAKTNPAPYNPSESTKNNKKKKKASGNSAQHTLSDITAQPDKDTETQVVTPLSSAKDITTVELILPTATPVATPLANPIMLSATDEEDQPSASNASAKISLPIITTADYGDWDNDNGFTLHTNRKQKREKPLPQSSYQPKPKTTPPSKKISEPAAPVTYAKLASKPAYPTKRDAVLTTIKNSSAPITTGITASTSSAIPSFVVTPLAVSAAAVFDLTKNEEKKLATGPVKTEPRKVNLTPEAHAIILKLKTAGAKLSYAVGGIVRDDLANASTDKADIDIVTQASLANLKEWFPLAEYPDQVITKNDKLFQFTINNRKIEIWISDYLANPHTDNPLKEDALSRGFNIEALYADENGNTLDPLNVHGYTEIDTLLDPVTSLQHDPIRILRAIYLSHKTGLQLSARLDKAIGETIACIANADKFSLRTLFSKIMSNEKSAEIFHDLEQRGIIRAAFPEFIDRMSSQEITHRLQSTRVDNSLSWVYINMAVDTAIDENKYRQVMAIQNPQQQLTAINQLLSEIQQYITRLKANKLLSATFTDPNYFNSLLETAFQSNRIMTDLRTEQSILVKAVALAKNTIENYAEENHALRQQYEAMIIALQQQKMQQAAAEKYQQQAEQQAEQQAYHQHFMRQQIAEQNHQQIMLYQQTLYAQSMQQQTQHIPAITQQSKPVFYNNQPQQLGQHRNGFVSSWRQPSDTTAPPNQYPHASTPQINEYKGPGQK